MNPTSANKLSVAPPFCLDDCMGCIVIDGCHWMHVLPSLNATLVQRSRLVRLNTTSHLPEAKTVIQSKHSQLDMHLQIQCISCFISHIWTSIWYFLRFSICCTKGYALTIILKCTVRLAMELSTKSIATYTEWNNVMHIVKALPCIQPQQLTPS